MKVLVTGAAGFIGRHLCQMLETTGHEVIPWDLPNQDITLPFGGPPPLDAVIHLAAIASPSLCDKDPGLAFRVNVQGTHNVLKMAVASGAKRLVFSSSAHVYKISPRYLPTDERHPLWLQDIYTTTKILGEQLCQLVYECHGLSYATLRLFNAYGPGQQPGYFIPDQILKARSGKLDLQGSDITKDWIYIDDVVEAFVKALHSSFVGSVNIGTGVDTDLRSIATIIADTYHVELNAHPAAVPTRMQCDWRRAESVLGWSPKVKLNEGLARTIQSSMRTVPEVT